MKKLLRRSPRGWIFACWLGYVCLFGAFLVSGGLAKLLWPASWPPMSDLWSVDPAALPASIDAAWYGRLRRLNFAYHIMHLGVFGALLGWLQATVLGRSRRRWAALGALGFLSLFVLEGLRPGIVTGGHPAPIEPILIAAGGGSLAGLYQWLYLRRGGIAAGGWFARWVGGLVLGVIAGAALLTALSPLLRPVARGLFADDEAFFFAGQVIFFTVYGSAVGLVAGWVSRRSAMEIPALGDASGSSSVVGEPPDDGGPSSSRGSGETQA